MFSTTNAHVRKNNFSFKNNERTVASIGYAIETKIVNQFSEEKTVRRKSATCAAVWARDLIMKQLPSR